MANTGFTFPSFSFTFQSMAYTGLNNWVLIVTNTPYALPSGQSITVSGTQHVDGTYTLLQASSTSILVSMPAYQHTESGTITITGPVDLDFILEGKGANTPIADSGFKFGANDLSALYLGQTEVTIPIDPAVTGFKVSSADLNTLYHIKRNYLVNETHPTVAGTIYYVESEYKSGSRYHTVQVYPVADSWADANYIWGVAGYSLLSPIDYGNYYNSSLSGKITTGTYWSTEYDATRAYLFDLATGNSSVVLKTLSGGRPSMGVGRF
jgi:hypothetical protein